MWPFPKKHFEWREPRLFRQTWLAVEDAKSKWWHKPLGAVILGLLLISSWAIARLDPNKNPPPAKWVISLAIPTGFFLVYFLAWIHRICPATISVFDQAILRIVANSQYRIEFKKIRTFNLRLDDNFHILALRLHSEKQVLIGVPSSVDVAALTLFLRERGIAHEAADERASARAHVG